MAFNYAINGTDIEQYCDAVLIMPERFAVDRGRGIILPGIDGEYDVPDKDTGSVDFVLKTYFPAATFFTKKESVSNLLNDQTSSVLLQRTLLDLTDVEISVRPIGAASTGTGSDRFGVSWPLRAITPFWRVQTPRVAVNPVPNIVVGGDGHVGDATYTFTAGTTPVLTNVTNGDKITLTASPGASPVVVNVAERTVKRASADWDANFEPNKQRWMRLEPGTNAFTLTGGGTVAVMLYEKRR